ncbi:MAG: carboxypeptidase-like regulatory domain-containing protein [Flavobacteriales bacterium]|nr:carboxypeptidase-like regulatory domain-containing protein [Flavobacteriales bacterium]
MKKLIIIVFLMGSIMSVMYAQENKREVKLSKIHGFILGSKGNTPLPFATIRKDKTNEASITNEYGYFEFSIESIDDSLLVSYIGYKSKRIPLEENIISYTIILEENILELNEVVVRPKDYSYLLDLIEKCRANQSQERIKGKAYYQLRSYTDNKQIELVENYYNSIIKGYNLLTLNPKSGRVGLRKGDQSFFASLETSRPIVRHKLFSAAKWFPLSPLHMTLKGIKKRFYIEPLKEYVDNRDSIVVVVLYPKKNRTRYFTTTLWINQTDNCFLKIELSGNNVKKFPLESLYEGDRLLDKNLKIVKTFKEIDGEMYFEQVHFNYEFIYHKKGKGLSKIYTKAIVQVYDYANQFELPQFGFLDPKMNDYQVPYNSFFWENNKELKLYDGADTSNLFMDSEYTLTNQVDKSNSSLGDFFNYKTYRWAEQRMNIKKMPQNTDYKKGQERINLKSITFLDLNCFNDSLHVYSVALFDTHESYYHYKIDTTALCFINMYFDLVEISRRSFERLVNSSFLSEEFVHKKYNENNKLLSEMSNLFLEETQQGTNISGMLRWNAKIKNDLGVDNLKFYQLYQTKENDKD